MRKFNLVKSLTSVINNIPALRGLGCSRFREKPTHGKRASLRMLILCLSLTVFGIEGAWGAWTGSGYGVKGDDGEWYVVKNESQTVTGSHQGPQYGSSISLSGSGSVLTFIGYSSGSYDHYITAQYSTDNSNWDDVEGSELTLTKKTGNVSSGDIIFPTNAKYLRFKRTAKNYSCYQDVVASGVYIKMAKYVDNPSVSSLDCGVGELHTITSNTFTIAWCNVPAIKFEIQDDTNKEFSCEIDNNAEEGKCNTTTVTIKCSNKTAGQHTATLKITDTFNNYSQSVSLTATTKKQTATMSWNPNTNILNKDETVSLSALTYSDPTREIIFTSSKDEVIAIIDNVPTAKSVGKATITATQAENPEFYETSASQEIIVTNKQKQQIEWTDKLSFKYEDSQFTQELNASAPSNNITYSLSDVTNNCVSLSGKVLTIKNYGTAYVTATAAETDDYVGVSMTRKVIIRNPSAACETIIYGPSAEHEFDLGWNEASKQSPKEEINFEGQEPRYVNFDYKGKSHNVLFEYYAGTLHVDEYVNGGWVEIKDLGQPTKNGSYVNTGNIALSRNATKMRVRVEKGLGYMYFNNLTVVLAKYLEVPTKTLSFDGQVGISATNTFDVNYSDVQGPIEITSSNSDIFSFLPSSIDVDCEQHGTKQVTVTLNSKTEINSISETITISNGIETPLNITVSGKVTKRKQTITWNDPTSFNSTDKPTLSATATSELAISSYSSDNESIAKVINGNQLEFYSSGKVNITAHQDGNDFYEPASLTKEFTINKVTPTIVTMPTVGNAITYGSKLSDVALTGGSAKDDKGNAVTGHFEWVSPNEIPHGGQQNYTVRFVPNNTNIYTSDAVSAETLAITVNKANQTLTWDVESPIKIKKESGNYTLTASSTSGRAITYTISKTELATINGNILTPLKSGDCKITAICPEDGDYNASNSIEKNLFIAGPDEIIWKYKDGDHVWAGQNLNAKGDLATAHTPVYFGGDLNYLEENNSTDPKTVYTKIASDGALVEINGLTEGDEYYSQVSSAIHVYIDRCYQGLVWDQNFLTYLADEQGHIDETVDLTAYAVDSLNRKTDLPIVYSVDNAAVAEVVGDATNGWKLHIIGAGEATLTASVAQTNIYQGVTETRKINVRKAGEPCGSYALISTSEKKISDIGDNTYTFAKPGETLTFKTRKYSILTLNANVTVEGYNIKEGAWQNIGKYNLDFTDKQTKTYPISEDIRKIKMYTDADLENSYRYISDLYITQKEYIRSSVDKIDEKIYINQDFSKTFTVDYSDKPYISCTIDNDQLEILRDDDNNTCGEYGTITFTVKNKNIWLTPTTIKGNITLSTSVGDNITIPVTIQVDLGGTYKFTNKLGDNDWNNLQNWDYGGSVPTSLPDIMNQILVQQPVRITNEVKVYELQVQTDATQGWDGSVTIAPTGGLTIYNGGAIGIDGKLTIESSREHTGYFRVVPDVVQKWVTTPTATMQYASKGSLDSGANRDATWQYFGIPVKGADFTVDYITWMYEWSEPNGWIDLRSKSQPVHLKPFQGYAITQYGQPTYNFTGSLNMGKAELTLTYTEGNGMWGDNMFANSFPSPIDVKLFTEEDFENLDYKTIYLYNSGSWNQWNEGTQGGAWEHLTDGAGAPGTFTAIPALAAPYLETEQTLIAPMQGMCIHTDQKSGATVHLDYAKHVWDAMPTGSKDDMNAPLLVPSRKKSSQKPEGVSDEAWENIQYAQYRHDSIEEAHKQKVAELRHRVRLTVYGENSGVDHIYLLEKDGFTADYDNGYDAYKMFSDGLLNVYTSEDFGEMAVAATDKLEGTFIGINAGEGETYQLKVSSVIGDNLYLKDLLNGAEIPLQEGQMYMFNAVPKLKETQRFVIVERENQGVGTSLDGVMGGDAYIWTDNENVHIEQAAANTLVRLFSSDGKLITTTTVSGSGEINISTLPNNVYMVMLNEQTYKFVKK